MESGEGHQSHEAWLQLREERRLKGNGSREVRCRETVSLEGKARPGLGKLTSIARVTVASGSTACWFRSGYATSKNLARQRSSATHGASVVR